MSLTLSSSRIICFGFLLAGLIALTSFYQNKNWKQDSSTDPQIHSARSERNPSNQGTENRKGMIGEKGETRLSDEVNRGRILGQDGWKELLTTTEGHDDRDNILAHYLQGWAGTSLDEAWAEAMRFDNSIKMASHCIKGAAMVDLKSMESRIVETCPDPHSPERKTLERLLWLRWGNLSPDEAIYHFLNNKSRDPNAHYAITEGILGSAETDAIARSIPTVLEFADSLAQEQKYWVYQALSQAKFTRPFDFDRIRQSLLELKKDGNISEDNLSDYIRQLDHRGVLQFPEHILESPEVAATASDFHLNAALFEIAKKNPSDAFSLYRGLPKSIGGDRLPIDGFVNKMMDFDPRGFGSHLNEMKPSSTKDQAVAAMVHYLIKKKAFDQADEWVQVISDESLKQNIEKSIRPPTDLKK